MSYIYGSCSCSGSSSWHSEAAPLSGISSSASASMSMGSCAEPGCLSVSQSVPGASCRAEEERLLRHVAHEGLSAGGSPWSEEEGEERSSEEDEPGPRPCQQTLVRRRRLLPSSLRRGGAPSLA